MDISVYVLRLIAIARPVDSATATTIAFEAASTRIAFRISPSSSFPCSAGRRRNKIEHEVKHQHRQSPEASFSGNRADRVLTGSNDFRTVLTKEVLRQCTEHRWRDSVSHDALRTEFLTNLAMGRT